MKNFQQNLLLALATSLCGLCTYQWYGQTLQRNQIENLSRLVYEKSAAIQGYTNSISTMDRQIAQMDAELSQLKQVAKTNDQVVLSQKRELSQLQLANEGLTNTVSQYQKGVDTLEAKLKEAYDGIRKQNDALKELAAQRDEFVKKLNDSVKDRNNVVNKYNELVAQVEKLQGAKQ